MKIGIEEIIHCAHKLKMKDKNHPCGRLHGHSYRVIVEIEGDQDNHSVTNNTDMLVEFGDLKRAIRVYDHQYLNNMTLLGKKILKNPTVENFAKWILHDICMSVVNKYMTVKVRIYETEDCWAEVIRKAKFPLMDK